MSYSSTTWQTGDVVTANKLNNIEQGIVALDTGLNNKAGKTVATTSANGLMSSTDKQHLDAVYTDYSAALTALGE